MRSPQRAEKDLVGRTRQPSRVLKPLLIAGALLASVSLSPARAGVATLPAFEHLQSVWNGISDYSVTIEAHEVLGTDSADSELHYAFKRPDHARMDVLKGLKSGSTIVYDGTDRVTAYRRSFSLFKMHGDVHDKNLTSLRGNGILNPNLGDLLACYSAHKDVLRESEGPTIDGKATDEVSLPYAGVTCPDDPAGDRGVVTLDVLDVERDSGLVVERKRYAGEQVVERWELSDYKVNSGLSDSDLR